MNPGKTSLPGASMSLREGHFRDYYYLNAKATCYAHGGGFDHYWRCGLFTLRGWLTEQTKWYLYGSRLIYRPVSRSSLWPGFLRASSGFLKQLNRCRGQLACGSGLKGRQVENLRNHQSRIVAQQIGLWVRQIAN